MSIDGGGWIVIQRRVDSSTNFYRGWSEYKSSFGNVSHNFWLGLDLIHSLTKKGAELRVDVAEIGGKRGFANYSNFMIGDESSNYKLNISGYSGSAGDSLRYHNGRMFSTKDRDNDYHYYHNCADLYKGAWWYYGCYLSNLNGLFPPGNGVSGARMTWVGLSNKYDSINYSEMKIRVKGKYG